MSGFLVWYTLRGRRDSWYPRGPVATWLSVEYSGIYTLKEYNSISPPCKSLVFTCFRKSPGPRRNNLQGPVLGSNQHHPKGIGTTRYIVWPTTSTVSDIHHHIWCPHSCGSNCTCKRSNHTPLQVSGILMTGWTLPGPTHIPCKPRGRSVSLTTNWPDLR